jgi:hypothetical protein
LVVLVVLVVFRVHKPPPLVMQVKGRHLLLTQLMEIQNTVEVQGLVLMVIQHIAVVVLFLVQVVVVLEVWLVQVVFHQ